MTVPRRLLLLPGPGWYHCVSRCVRRAFLCGDAFEHRKAWVVERLRLLAQCFAVEVGAYAVMSNHLHVVVRVDPEAPAAWPAEAVAERWLTVFCKHYSATGEPIAPAREWILAMAQDAAWVADKRRRLGDLGWFMKALKEPIARRANREDGCTGAFWEGRFRSTALLDEKALLACLAYVDLNPIRAQVAATPEASGSTSVQDRIHARQYHEARAGLRRAAPDRARRLFARLDPSSEPTHAEDGLWLWPLGQVREGRQLITVDEYLRLVDTTGRLLRRGKRGAIAADLRAILNRLDLDVDAWIAAMTLGRQMGGTALGEHTARAIEARRRGVGWVANKCLLFVRTRTDAAA